MRAEQVLSDLRERGIELELAEGRLLLKGKYGEAEQSMVREHKAELIYLLERHQRLRTPTDDEWAAMRVLGAHVGQRVTDGRRDYLLWGVTPHGAICDNGRVLLTFLPEKLSPMPD